MKLKTKNNKPEPLPLRTYRRAPTTDHWLDKEMNPHKLDDHGCNRLDLIPLTK